MLLFKNISYYDPNNDSFEEETDFLKNKRAKRLKARENKEKIIDFNSKLPEGEFITIVSQEEGEVCSAIICDDETTCKKLLEKFLKYMDVPNDDCEPIEVTVYDMERLLDDANCNGFYEENDRIMEKFRIDLNRRSMNYGENLIQDVTKASLYKQVKDTLYKDSLTEELDRIYTKGGKKCYGHPCQYMFLTVDDADVRRDMNRALLSALYQNNRLKSRRYIFTDISPTDRNPKRDLERLFEACSGGSIIVRYCPVGGSDEENDSASVNRYCVELICQCMKKFRNETLTILDIPYNNIHVKNLFYEYLGSVNIVECKEEYAQDESCIEYLKTLCSKQKIRGDKNLFDHIEKNKKYSANELKLYFEEWYNEKLRTTVYPQYKNVTKAEQVAIAKKDTGTAMEQLNELIGLTEAKKVIQNAKDYFTAQKLFKDKGFKMERPALSMVFTGNPGSAKTTVARLVSEIFYDSGILTERKIVELGRGDLVGKYVGWTAPTVIKKFQEAKNSVLFIDEAYSLVDDRNGSYGDEAINTIVQEMENHRDEVLVIFAGYPDKMEEFLKKNPGLRSRIAFHVHFDDYNADELCEISTLIAKKKGLKISKEAMEKLHKIYTKISKDKDFGNGRAARNIIENAKMTMATRLMKGDISRLTEDDVTTIMSEDISEPIVKSEERRVVGF